MYLYYQENKLYESNIQHICGQPEEKIMIL